MYNIKLAIRNLKKHKGYTIINIAGLSVGVAFSLLIMLFVFDELSYDKYHEKADRTYRVAVDAVWGNTLLKQTYTTARLAPTLAKDFPEVEAAVRIGNHRKQMVKYNENWFEGFQTMAVDSSIFNVFTIPIVNGSIDKALKEPKTVVITESTAKKIFGAENPVNKTIEIYNEKFTVSAVVKDCPHNTHFKFDILSNLEWFGYSREQNWMNNNFQTYFTIKENTTTDYIESQFQPLLLKNLNWFEGFLKEGNKWDYYLQSVTDIHLTSHLTGEFEANS
ncbi:ABC transporter permease, partial [Bacteroidales bacterium]|nr:ABC transporter permease [Bacteroidales bacterium]